MYSLSRVTCACDSFVRMDSNIGSKLKILLPFIWRLSVAVLTETAFVPDEYYQGTEPAVIASHGTGFRYAENSFVN